MLPVDKIWKVVQAIYNQPLPKNLHFHNFTHVTQVYDAAGLLGEQEGFTEKNMSILRTAALIHDIGYLVSPNKHEERGVLFAQQFLPLFNATKKEIEIVSGLILATKMPQKPKTYMEYVLCDADLSLSGQPDYLEKLEPYRQELNITDMKKWYELQTEFLINHKWFTPAAKYIFDKQKKSNLANVRLLLKDLTEGENTLYVE